MPPDNSIRLPQSQSSPVDWEGASPLQPNFVWPRTSLWPTSPLFTPWGAAPALPGKPRCQFGGKTSRRQRLLTTCGSVVGRSPCQALSSTLPCYIDLCCLVLSRLEICTKREEFEEMVALCFLSLLLFCWEVLPEREMGGRISQNSTSSANTKEVKSAKNTNNSRLESLISNIYCVCFVRKDPPGVPLPLLSSDTTRNRPTHRYSFLPEKKLLMNEIYVFLFFMQGTFSWEKNCCSFGFCPNYTPPPNLDNLHNFFRRRNSGFERQFRTKNTIYTIYIILYIYNLKTV